MKTVKNNTSTFGNFVCHTKIITDIMSERMGYKNGIQSCANNNQNDLKHISGGPRTPHSMGAPDTTSGPPLHDRAETDKDFSKNLANLGLRN